MPFATHREAKPSRIYRPPPGCKVKPKQNCASVTGTLPSLGSIAAHKSADVILVDGDPTKDISAIRKISLVMKEGEVFYPAEIYEALGVKRFAEPPHVEHPDARRQIPTPVSGASTRHAH